MKPAQCLSRVLELVLAIGLLIVVSVRPAFAGYLDPGSGSFNFQLLIAFLMGLLFSAKLLWTHIKAFFSRRPTATSRHTPEPDADSDPTS